MIRASTAALVLCAALLPAGARGSGAIKRLGLKQAVGRASVVLVVEKARPAREKRTLKIPYRKNGKRRIARVEVQYLRFRVVRARVARSFGSTSGRSYLRPGKTCRFDRGKLSPGSVIRLVDSNVVISHRVKVRYLRDGTRKIPFYPRLARKLGRADLARGRRFVLLATFNVAYEALEGVGGLGLLPAAAEKRVLGAIADDRLVPLDRQRGKLPPPPPARKREVH